MSVLKTRKGPHCHEGPYVDAVEFIDLDDDPSAQMSALASQQIHGLYQVGVSQVKLLQALPHVQMHEAKTAATAVVQMIIDRKPFDDPKVRLAMRYAMDCNQVLDISHRGLGLPGEHHIVCPVHPEYAPLPEMTRDVDKAKALLAEAGYPDGIDIEFNAKKEPDWELQAVQVMVEHWKATGIRARINVMPSAQFWDVWDKFDLGFVEWAHRPLGFMVLSLGFRTGVPWNPTKFADKEFDDLLTRAEGTLDVEKRREIMAAVETIMQQRGPICQPVWRSIISRWTSA